MENKFENFVKESLENYEVEYNPAHWDRVEKALNNKPRPGRYILGGVVLIGSILASAVYFNNDEAVPQKTIAAKVQQQNYQEAVPQETAAASTTDAKPVITATEIIAEPIQPAGQPAQEIKVPGTEINPAPKAEAPVNTPGNKTFSKDLMASIDVSRTQGCVSEAFHFEADVNVPASYQWFFGDGATSTLPAPSHVYTKPGKYSVTLKVTSLLDGKTLKTGEGGIVLVNPKPDARFNWDVAENENFSRKVEFTNQTRNITYSQWIIDGKPYSGEEVKVKFNRKGSYAAALVVRNELGCYDTLTQNIVLNKDYNLMAPTAFTPNGDGHNDDFIPEILRNADVNYTMDIVDSKTGSTIYSSNKRAWDGINQRTGAKANDGTYVWIITLIKGDNTRETFKGNVSVLK